MSNFCVKCIRRSLAGSLYPIFINVFQKSGKGKSKGESHEKYRTYRSPVGTDLTSSALHFSKNFSLEEVKHSITPNRRNLCAFGTASRGRPTPSNCHTKKARRIEPKPRGQDHASLIECRNDLGSFPKRDPGGASRSARRKILQVFPTIKRSLRSGIFIDIEMNGNLRTHVGIKKRSKAQGDHQSSQRPSIPL